MKKFFVFLIFLSTAAISSSEDDTRPGSITVFLTPHPYNTDRLIVEKRSPQLSFVDFTNQPDVQGDVLNPERLFSPIIKKYVGIDREIIDGIEYLIYPTPESFISSLMQLQSNRFAKVYGIIGDTEFLILVSNKKWPLSINEPWKAKLEYHSFIHDFANHSGILLFPQEWVDYVALRVQKFFRFIEILKENRSQFNYSDGLPGSLIHFVAVKIDAGHGSLSSSSAGFLSKEFDDDEILSSEIRGFLFKYLNIAGPLEPIFGFCYKEQLDVEINFHDFFMLFCNHMSTIYPASTGEDKLAVSNAVVLLEREDSLQTYRLKISLSAYKFSAALKKQEKILENEISALDK